MSWISTVFNHNSSIFHCILKLWWIDENLLVLQYYFVILGNFSATRDGWKRELWEFARTRATIDRWENRVSKFEVFEHKSWGENRRVCGNNQQTGAKCAATQVLEVTRFVHSCFFIALTLQGKGGRITSAFGSPLVIDQN